MKMSSSKSKSTKKSNEEVFAGFQNLRTEQRQLASKISELEMDLNEHKIVSSTLSTVEETRRCFRLVGGVLVERSVGQVLPELTDHSERLPKAIAALTEQLAEKGKQINAYVEQHDIRLHKPGAPAAPTPAETHTNTSNVLVASE